MSKEHPRDVRDMAIVHRLFRQAYDEAARLVRAARHRHQGGLRSWLTTSISSLRGCTAITKTKTRCCTRN
jgi:hypothetical protein